jgi:hypothetical protein
MSNEGDLKEKGIGAWQRGINFHQKGDEGMAVDRLAINAADNNEKGGPYTFLVDTKMVWFASCSQSASRSTAPPWPW